MNITIKDGFKLGIGFLLAQAVLALAVVVGLFVGAVLFTTNSFQNYLISALMGE